MNIPQRLLLSTLFLLPVSLVMAQSVPVNVADAEFRNLSPSVWISGTVISPNDANVAAQASGRLLSLIEVGDTFFKGDIIAEIDAEPLKLREKELTAELQSEQHKLDFLNREVTRLVSLAKNDLAAQKQLEQVSSDRDVANSDLQASHARLAQLQKELEFTKLKAPFAGVMVERIGQTGELIDQGTAIARLVEMANLQVSANFPLTSYPFLKKGQDIKVSSIMGEHSVPIKALVPVADQRSHLMEIRLDMSSIDWPVGLDVKVSLPIGKSENILTVPRDALVLRREGNSIFKVDSDNKVQQVTVEVGIGEGSLIGVTGDLKSGDQVVIRGAERLRPGQEVKIKDNNSELVSQ